MGETLIKKKTNHLIITIVERRTRNTILTVKKNLSKAGKNFVFAASKFIILTESIRLKIETHCKSKIRVFTDDYTIYLNLEKHKQIHEHHVINHPKKEYAHGDNHVNNCENRHSLLRQYLRIFRGISKKKLNTYVKFFQFTFIYGVNWLENALEIILKDCTIIRR